MTAVVVALLWAPVYLSGARGQLFLFPIALVIGGFAALVALVAGVLGGVALVQRRGSRAMAGAGMIVSAVVVLAGIPAIWFGDVFAA